MRRYSARYLIIAFLYAVIALAVILPIASAVAGRHALRVRHKEMTHEVALRVSQMVAQMYDVMDAASQGLYEEIAGIHREEALVLRTASAREDLAAAKIRAQNRLPSGTHCDVAVIAPSGLILGTTYAPEQGLDMGGFPDVTLLLKQARETGRVLTEFPVQESTAEHMRIYTYSAMEGGTNFLQMAFWTDHMQGAYRRLMGFLTQEGGLAQVSVYMLIDTGKGLTLPAPVFDMVKAVFCGDLPEDKVQLITQAARTGTRLDRNAKLDDHRVIEHYVAVPLVQSAGDLRMRAVVCVGVDETSYRSTVMAHAGLSAFLTLVALVASWLVCRFLDRRLFKPLHAMTEQIQASAPVDLAGAATRTEELMTIATRYNDHLTRIRAHQSELQAANERAEQTVRERTAELQRINGELRTSETQLRKLSAALLTLQDDERRRIAADLHDSLGQSLCAVKMRLEALEADQAPTDPAGLAGSLATCRQMVDGMLAEVRGIVAELRPLVLDLHGLEHALDWLYEQYATTPNVAVECQIQPVGDSVPASLQTPVFRIAQEALNNAIRHSGASRILLELGLREDGRLRLAITDNGKGFDPAALRSSEGAHFGLLTMRERARLSGGEFSIVSSEGKGTVIEVLWVLAAEEGE